MASDSDRVAEEADEGMNAAEPGRIIADSEERVRGADAESMMALASQYHTGLWNTYWKSQRPAA